MDHLPLDLIDNILFRLDHISMVVMQCTNKFLRTYISDPKFDSYRFSGVGSGLFFISKQTPYYIFCQHNILISYPCYILGSCSGLLMLDVGGCVYVANPFTNRTRFVDHSGSKILSDIVTTFINRVDKAMCVGLAVDRIQNQSTKRFKIVCIVKKTQMTYGFEISDGRSWRLSETTIVTASSESDLTTRTKPVYLEGTLHWLRNDGSIIAFDPETEKGSFIPSVFHPERELLFASDDKINRLSLVSGTREEISVYTLTENAEWALARLIKNVFMEQSELEFWDVVMYDGKRLVVREKKRYLEGVFHVYDMEASNWGVLGSAFLSSRGVTDFYKLAPSLSFVEEDEVKDTIPCYDRRVCYLTALMRSRECPYNPLTFEGPLQNLKLEP